MKISVEISKKEKGVIITIMLALAIIIFYYNRRYLYILDAEFSDDIATSIVLKVGFIFPVKIEIPMDVEFKKRLPLYGYNISVTRNGDNFNIFLNKNRIQTVYTASYYDDTHKRPVERVYLN